MRLLLAIVIAGCLLSLAGQSALAQQSIKTCVTGTITLGPFAAHIAEIRKVKRYEPADISKLIADARAGGPDFFSTQVVIKEEQSSSGDYDLNLFQGFSDPQTKYRSIGKWRCDSNDYPVAYFVGFKVEAIGGMTITVSRHKGTVDVISLKAIDPGLDKPVSVTESASHAVLCKDIAKGCIKTIFYGRY